jgi:hypothetical protein
MQNRRRISMKRLEKTIMFVGVYLVMTVFVCSFAAAQDASSSNMQILAEKIKADKKLLVAANMQLTEAEAGKFWPVYEQYQDELFILRARTLKLIKTYTEKYESMTNDIAKKLLDEYLEIEGLRQKVRKAYLPKFRKVLPEIKVARYYQIENKINAVVNYELASQIPLVETNR